MVLLQREFYFERKHDSTAERARGLIDKIVNYRATLNKAG